MLKMAFNTCYFYLVTVVVLSAMIFSFAISAPETDFVGARGLANNYEGAAVVEPVNGNPLNEPEPEPLQRRRRFLPFHFSKSFAISGGFGL